MDQPGVVYANGFEHIFMEGTGSVTDARPEHELLICAARVSVDSETAGSIRALVRRGLDWAYLLKAANGHGAQPLLYLHLKEICPDLVPETILGKLREHFFSNAKRNLYLTGELLKILQAFDRHRIRVIPYKGPALAASVYGNLALREFADLDLLVREQNVPAARELMLSLGYSPQLNLSSARDAAFLQYQCEHLFHRAEDDVLVEIQWRIAPRYFSFPLDYDSLWERLEPASLGGTEVLTLSPEDSLLILCVHGSKHLWQRLGWICDIAELIHVEKGMDWERVIKHAEELGSQRMLYLGLFLARSLLGATVPETLSRRLLGDRKVRDLGARVRRRFFSETERSILGSCLFHLRARECLRHRLQYCLRLALTTTLEDWEFVPLPVSLSFLYYPLRPIRLIKKYAFALFFAARNGNVA